MSEPEKTQVPKKMNFEEFFEVVVGKSTAMMKEIQKKIDAHDEYLLDELEKYAVDNNLPIPQWILDKYPTRNEKASAAKPIEFETIEIKVPKAVMEFLRKTSNKGPAAWIEPHVVDAVRAYLEAVEPDTLRDWFNLGPTFREVLGEREVLDDKKDSAQS